MDNLITRVENFFAWMVMGGILYYCGVAIGAYIA